jgi:hypothetical protein
MKAIHKVNLGSPIFPVKDPLQHSKVPGLPKLFGGKIRPYDLTIPASETDLRHPDNASLLPEDEHIPVDLDTRRKDRLVMCTGAKDPLQPFDLGRSEVSTAETDPFQLRNEQGIRQALKLIRPEDPEKGLFVIGAAILFFQLE